jgi:hypothetical protein
MFFEVAERGVWSAMSAAPSAHRRPRYLQPASPRYGTPRAIVIRLCHIGADVAAAHNQQAVLLRFR